MADQLYLSLWYPNFRFASLPTALMGVMQQFARIAADGQASSPYTRVSAASAYPIDWSETPAYQRVFVNDDRSESTEASAIDAAVAEATEQLYEDTAYEFEMRWPLWTPASAQAADGGTETIWKLEPHKVLITGFGPQFADAAYEQNGHIRVDFGLDTPWTFDLEDDEALDEAASRRIQQNVEKLLAFTLSVEKHCGISSRLLWTESGEPLAEKLIARLQRVN